MTLAVKAGTSSGRHNRRSHAMTASNDPQILRIDTSLRAEASVSRRLGDEILERLLQSHPGAAVHTLDLAQGMHAIDSSWVEANFTAPEQRSADQRARLAASDQAVAQLASADLVVLTLPIYNFSVPAALRDWIDHVCRAGLSFRYTADGPQGLLADRPVYVAVASGGVPLGSAVDFATPYLRQVFRFIGIEDLRLVGASGTARDAEAAMTAAMAELDRWLPPGSGARAA
jgi:FMN-dependent NADH-azoreductase